MADLLPRSDEQILGRAGVDDQHAALRNRLEAGVRHTRKSPNDIPPQIQHIVGPFAECLILQRLELLMPSVKHPTNGRFGS